MNMIDRAHGRDKEPGEADAARLTKGVRQVCNGEDMFYLWVKVVECKNGHLICSYEFTTQLW